MAPRLSQLQKDARALPADFKTCLDSDWSPCESNNKYTVMYDEKFQEKFISSPYIDTLKVMASQITSMLVSLGKPQTRDTLFRYLLDPALPIIAKHTSQELFSRNKAPTSEEEIWEFVATMYLFVQHI